MSKISVFDTRNTYFLSQKIIANSARLFFYTGNGAFL